MVVVSFRVVLDPVYGSIVWVVRWVVISGVAAGATTVGSMVHEARASTAAAARIRDVVVFMMLDVARHREIRDGMANLPEQDGC